MHSSWRGPSLQPGVKYGGCERVRMSEGIEEEKTNCTVSTNPGQAVPSKSTKYFHLCSYRSCDHVM